MLAGLMPQGSVLPLDLIGIEGARVFRKNMLRYDDPFRKNKKVAILGVFLFFFWHPDQPHAGAMGGVAWARRLC